MKAADYNPETLDRIRQGASAAMLGWDDHFYSTVCRKHELTPVLACAAIKAAPKETAPLSCAEVQRPKVGPDYRRPSNGIERVRGLTFAVSKSMRDRFGDAAREQGASLSGFAPLALALRPSNLSEPPLPGKAGLSP